MTPHHKNIYYKPFTKKVLHLHESFGTISAIKKTQDSVLGMLGTYIGQVPLKQQPGNWQDINYI